MVDMVRSINHSGAVILRFYRFSVHVQFCLISIPLVLFVFYGFFLCVLCFFFFFVDNESEDDSKHDQLFLGMKTEIEDSGHREKHGNISSAFFFINGSSLISILMHFFPCKIFTLYKNK